MIINDSKLTSLISWLDYRDIASRFLKRCFQNYKPNLELPPDAVIDETVDLIGRLAQMSESAKATTNKETEEE